jgi:hypothetical protein
VDKNNNLENGVRVQMDELNLVVIKESVEEIVGREAKSALEEGREHQNLRCIRLGKSSPVAGRNCKMSRSRRK